MTGSIRNGQADLLLAFTQKDTQIIWAANPGEEAGEKGARPEVQASGGPTRRGLPNEAQARAGGPTETAPSDPAGNARRSATQSHA